MDDWEKESTRIFIDNVLENLGLGPGVSPIITPNQQQSVNIVEPVKELSTEDILRELKSVVSKIDPSKIDSMNDNKLISIIDYLEELT